MPRDAFRMALPPFSNPRTMSSDSFERFTTIMSGLNDHLRQSILDTKPSTESRVQFLSHMTALVQDTLQLLCDQSELIYLHRMPPFQEPAIPNAYELHQAYLKYLSGLLVSTIFANANHETVNVSGSVQRMI
jgi:hypothetical protein